MNAWTESSSPQPRGNAGGNSTSFGYRSFLPGVTEIVQSGFERTAPPERPPWGRLLGVAPVLDGIWHANISSLDAWQVSPERNARIHPVWRRSDRWYGRDRDWAIVAHTFRDELEGGDWLDAPGGECDTWWLEHHLKNQLPDEWETVTGTELKAGESLFRTTEELREANVNEFIINMSTRRACGGATIHAVRASDKKAICVVVPQHETPGKVLPGAEGYFRTNMKSDGLLLRIQFAVSDGRFRSDRGAAARLKEMEAEYDSIMAKLNPGTWNDPQHPGNARGPEQLPTKNGGVHTLRRAA